MSNPLPNTTIFVYSVALHLESMVDVNVITGPYIYEGPAVSCRVRAGEEHLEGDLKRNPGYSLRKVVATRLKGDKLRAYQESKGQKRLI